MDSTNSTRKNGEGLVVTQDGRRTSGNVHVTQESANREIAQQKPQLRESNGASTPAVKQQLFG